MRVCYEDMLVQALRGCVRYLQQIFEIQFPLVMCCRQIRINDTYFVHLVGDALEVFETGGEGFEFYGSNGGALHDLHEDLVVREVDVGMVFV